MEVHIDRSAGFCFGVERAIQLAEEEIKKSEHVFCIGEIVHNPDELKRLNKAGLTTIDLKDLKKNSGKPVLFRAHGEPPESFKIVREHNIGLIDATCPVVLKFQSKLKKAVLKAKTIGGQVVIFGKKEHPEIKGLVGHSGGSAIVISAPEDLSLINLSKPVLLFSQTTANIHDYEKMASLIREQMLLQFQNKSIPLEINNTICKRVTNRIPALEKFAKENEVIIFVSGKNSSNGRFLFEVCKNFNARSYSIENENEIDVNWFNNIKLIGLSGATSTPVWLLEKIADKLRKLKTS